MRNYLKYHYVDARTFRYVRVMPREYAMRSPEKLCTVPRHSSVALYILGKSLDRSTHNRVDRSICT